ncbi:DNA alkylation repair protein [Cellulophaga sp. F20128]|uniref:DNA alkylation repair protein n=1 Tax=Cellulophaga sp. F20128 TaxID=2926413 RepID=UPI001FF49DDB|nr:DNA alkylation repair protein [Cellulophaga sp. F20128]MCK0157550.1 DNA alkylation repair protein [Cellulophaga sp. F20128]
MHQKFYITELESEFKKNGVSAIAAEQKAYMRNQFNFCGLKTGERRQLQRPFLVAKYLPIKKELPILIKALWEKPERDFQLFGQELAFKYITQLEKNDLTLFEYMITHKSWWVTTDFISVKLVGAYFKKYPELKEGITDKWVATNDIWLQRSALLFQLKYKEEIDTNLLSKTIYALVDSKAFFINKAIGWVLREYSRTNPNWVTAFAAKTPLSNLSKKEALRLLN